MTTSASVEMKAHSHKAYNADTEYVNSSKILNGLLGMPIEQWTFTLGTVTGGLRATVQAGPSNSRLEELERAELPSKIAKAMNKLGGVTSSDEGGFGERTFFLPLIAIF